MDKKLLTIILLTISAALLAAANLLPSSARADNVVNSRDYQCVTAGITSGGEGLYILDNRTGQLAIYTYDPASHSVLPRAVRSMADIMATK
jgi:hypothetical protein